jgi:phosphate starvation-inducible membrane PsiE
LALAGVSGAFFIRIMILESKNALLDLILPFAILALIALIYLINKQSRTFG